MNGFYYTDIFSTKGIEYLLIISFFLAYIPFYRYLREVQSPLFSLAKIRLPRGVLFDRTHTWAYLKAEGRVMVGIDDFLAALTGPVSLKRVKQPGDEVKRGDHLATLQSGTKQLKIYAPISGTLKSVNTAAIKRFSKRTHNDFTENWLFDMEPKRWDLEKALLLIGDKAQHWIQQESSRFKDVLAYAQRKYEPNLAPVLLQEGGEIVDQVLQDLPEEIWLEVQSEFIDSVKE
jgi:glycine cleavage system H protein